MKSGQPVESLRMEFTWAVENSLEISEINNC